MTTAPCTSQQKCGMEPVLHRKGRSFLPRTPSRSKTLRNRINMDDKNLLEKGFTLVELLVVVAILGILAAVAIFAVGNLTNDAKKNACATEASSVEVASTTERPTDPNRSTRFWSSSVRSTFRVVASPPKPTTYQPSSAAEAVPAKLPPATSARAPTVAEMRI